MNGRPYLGISASTFDPSRSNRMIVMPTPMQDAAAWAGVPQVATQSGEREQGGAIIALSAPDAADRDPISGLVTRLRAQPMPIRTRTTAGGDDNSRMLSIDRVDATSPIVHSHIDSGIYASDGMVDEPSANQGAGDASSLLNPYPVPGVTVSHGLVGWHVLDNGQLKFLYPAGSMNSSQVGKMLDNLNRQQTLLQRGK